ncbi:MAG: DEAD/DEAH box helicase [Actinomycetota bacterium]|nr:DEAD/DEAH box helicase [Actinomycetota bacterium]
MTLAIEPTATRLDAPVANFADLGVSSAIATTLAQRGIDVPTAVQISTIPDALAGRDVCGKAPTGSGKTVAFGVPLATRIGRGRPGRPRGLVLVPTRELATQVAAELAPLLAVQRRRLATFFGGVGFGPQIRALRDAVDVAVACPGRLEDLRRSGHLALDGVDLVVVDEADRLADMGFLPALRRILDATAESRQTLLFSATLDGAVDAIVRRYQTDPVRHEVAATVDDSSRMSHRFTAVASDERVAACADVLAGSPASIVFVRTRHGADRLVKQLGRMGIESAAIHGDRSQPQRQRALESFRTGSVRALVATDVAARGIHVDGVSCVVHFDMPAEATDYVHRSGRTARAGASGTVVSLVTEDQHATVHQFIRILGLDAELDGITTSTTGRSAGARDSARGKRTDSPRSSGTAGQHANARSSQATHERKRTRARFPDGAGGTGSRRGGRTRLGDGRHGAARSARSR